MSNTQFALYAQQRVNRNQANFGQDKEHIAPEKPNGLRQPRAQLEACRPLRGQRVPEQLGPVVDSRFGIARCNALPPTVQPEPVTLHQQGARPVQLGLTAIEEPEESPQEKQTITLKNFAAQLKTLSMAIHTSQVEIQGWEQLDIVHKKSQQFNSEKNATMRECDALKKQLIMKGARSAAEVTFSGNRIHFFDDFSPAVEKKRREFLEAKTSLRDLGIRYQMLYPAVLRVTDDGGVRHFRSADEAQRFVEETKKAQK
ncbi:LINE-1 retrotransposable element ORF1 protein [Liparis tanakae]|uniref:LINE-1 retrotransposable element ORF1 protein n=1 Tax=Liparis tanakae TaxID=230148 RepID=A0A4Z2H8R4_9TELE|nr:LINE-1 retrotransposable element ORF1 protein [Liparis tanakae]